MERAVYLCPSKCRPGGEPSRGVRGLAGPTPDRAARLNRPSSTASPTTHRPLGLSVVTQTTPVTPQHPPRPPLPTKQQPHPQPDTCPPEPGKPSVLWALSPTKLGRFVVSSPPHHRATAPAVPSQLHRGVFPAAPEPRSKVPAHGSDQISPPPLKHFYPSVRPNLSFSVHPELLDIIVLLFMDTLSPT